MQSARLNTLQSALWSINIACKNRLIIVSDRCPSAPFAPSTPHYNISYTHISYDARGVYVICANAESFKGAKVETRRNAISRTHIHTCDAYMLLTHTDKLVRYMNHTSATTHASRTHTRHSGPRNTPVTSGDSARSLTWRPRVHMCERENVYVLENANGI